MEALNLLTGKTVNEILKSPYASVIIRCADGANLRIDDSNDGAEFEWIDDDAVAKWEAVQRVYRKTIATMEKFWEFHRRAQTLPEEGRIPFGYGGFHRAPQDEWPNLADDIAFMERYDEIRRAGGCERREEELLAEMDAAGVSV